MIYDMQIMEGAMPLESNVNQGAVSWLDRLWQNFVLLGEAVELNETERLERRIAALEAAAIKASDHARQD